MGYIRVAAHTREKRSIEVAGHRGSKAEIPPGPRTTRDTWSEYSRFSLTSRTFGCLKSANRFCTTFFGGMLLLDPMLFMLVKIFSHPRQTGGGATRAHRAMAFLRFVFRVIFRLFVHGDAGVGKSWLGNCVKVRILARTT